MKTAMELALTRIELMKDIDKDSIHWQMFKQNYLEKEKEQICNAYVEGLEGLYMGAEEYYNQEYGQAGRTFTQDLIPKN